MAWIEKLVKFLYDNWTLIKDNFYIFLLFAIICISLTLLVNKIINSSKDKKIKELKDDINKLTLEVENIKNQYDSLQDKFRKSSINQRLLAGISTNEKSPLAQNMSKNL